MKPTYFLGIDAAKHKMRAAFMGNDPRLRQSGQWKGHTKMSKRGVETLKADWKKAVRSRGISGQTVVQGGTVFVDSNGKLGTMTASTRFSDEIKPMDKASEAILTLKPVTFRYKREIDPRSIRQFGLIAEEVEKVDPDLVGRDEKGKVYNVRYEALNAMLLNEFLKEHRKVEQLTKDFESKLAEQQKQIEALTMGLQKVSAQLDASKATLQVVGNP